MEREALDIRYYVRDTEGRPIITVQVFADVDDQGNVTSRARGIAVCNTEGEHRRSKKNEIDNIVCLEGCIIARKRAAEAFIEARGCSDEIKTEPIAEPALGKIKKRMIQLTTDCRQSSTFIQRQMDRLAQLSASGVGSPNPLAPFTLIRKHVNPVLTEFEMYVIGKHLPKKECPCEAK